MADGVKVDLDALTTFARALGASVDGNLQSAVIEVGAMEGFTGALKDATGAQDPPRHAQDPQDPTKIVPPVRSGFLEAQDFSTRHHVMAHSAQQFLTDALDGLVALAAGAETCAVRYAGTDAANAALFRDHPAADQAHPFTALALPLAGSATVTADGVAAAFAPGPDGSTPAPVPSALLSPKAAPRQSTPATATPNGPAWDADKAALAERLRRGEDIEPVRPRPDPGAGGVYGPQPEGVVVPPDSAPMPVQPPRLPVSGSEG